MVAAKLHMSEVVTIEPMLPQHWDSVRRIYEEGILTGQATFQIDLPTWEAWDSGHAEVCRLIAVSNSEVVGWAALSPVSSRCVYNGVGEVSVYVCAAARGRGIGKLLLQSLVEESERHGYWTLQSGVFPENASSMALHHACGFRTVGIRERIGKMGDTWRDTCLLERRSKNIKTT